MYFVYRHVRLDKNIPFYIGIGKKYNNNLDYRRAYSSNTRSKLWTSIFNKTEIKVEILFEHENRDIITEKEKEFISLYGRIDIKTGTLANHTSGGEQNLGLSIETKEKMRQRMIGNTLMVGRKDSSITKKKKSLAQLGKKRSQEVISKIIERNIGNKFGEGNKGYKHTDETKKYWSSIRKNKITFQSKIVLCIETGIEYPSITLCMIGTFGENTKSTWNGIQRAIKNQKHTCRNYHFKFI